MTESEYKKLVDARKKDHNAGRYKLMDMTGCTEATVKAFIKGAVRMSDSNPVKKVKTLADFKATYDKATIVPSRVKIALKTLGSNGWAYEVEFSKMAGVTLGDLGMFRDQFADYIVSLKEGRRVWAGSVSTAKQMKEMI